MNLPDPTTAHTKQVLQIVDKNKIFNSQAGPKKKFMVEFVDGYSAEYCPHVNQTIPFNKNDLIHFKINHRKEINGAMLDEITWLNNISNKPSPPGELPKAAQAEEVKPKICNMHGHPATIALAMAVNLHVAQIPYKPEFLSSEVRETAEELLQWLIAKNNCEE